MLTTEDLELTAVKAEGTEHPQNCDYIYSTQLVIESKHSPFGNRNQSTRQIASYVEPEDVQHHRYLIYNNI